MYEQEILTAADVKRAGYRFGADIVSIGSIERWKDVPTHQNPKTIMPNAKSVVCIGFRIHKGTLRGAAEGTYYSAYTLSGFEDINKVIAPIAQRQMASFLEDYGYEAVPVMYYSHTLTGRTNMTTGGADLEGEMQPDVFIDFRLAGALCGAGELGHSRMLLTPEFGPAQRVFFIITEAELEPDPIVTGICDHCMECVRKCPMKALKEEDDDSYEIPGVLSVKRSSLDNKKCRLAHISGGHSKFAPEEVRKYARELANDEIPFPTDAELKERITDKVQYKSPANIHALCGDGCIRACLAHLEKTGKLTRRFHNKQNKYE